MKQHLLTLFLALAASVGTLFAQSGTCGDNLTWTLDTESGILTISGTGAMTNYSYSNSWYSYRSSIFSVVISEGVSSIGKHAFYECSSLTSITIPNSVTSIGYGAFDGCSSLTSVTIPNSVTTIGSYAFYNCSSLTSIEIPNSVTSIGESAFYYCNSLTAVHISDLAAWCKITFDANPLSYAHNLYLNGTLVTDLVIPDGVTSIGYEAFIDCSSLTSITIPNSVTSIGNYAFSGCRSLTSINVDASNSEYCDIGGVLFSKDKTTLVQYPAGKTAATYTIPNSVTSIGYGAFDGCSSLTSVTIPNSVTTIGSYAFYNCSSLTSIEIPNSVTSIGESAFYYCNSLTSVHISDIAVWCKIAFSNSTSNPLFYAYNLYLNGALVTDLVIPDGVTSIKSYAFYFCLRLTSITIPNSVTSIGAYAFDGCTGLTSVTIPNSVTSIGSSAFSGCRSLTSITIPNSVTSIGSGAFSVCSSLTSITIPNSVTSIGDDAFDGCWSLTSITIPNSVTSIGDDAFSDCRSLTAVHISDIAAWCKIAFGSDEANPLYYAHNLYLNGTLVTDLVIPDGVTSIGSYAFSGCNGLTSIAIPNSVTSIGNYAFYECWNCWGFDSPARQKRKATAENDDNSPSTNYIRCEAITPPLLGNDVFGFRRYMSGSGEPWTLYVPSQSVDAYKAADQWKDFNVQPIMDCGTINTTDGITVWEDQLPYTWEGISFTTAGTETKTLQASDGCDSIVTFTLRVLYRNITLQENESSDYYTQFANDYNGRTVNTATLNRQFTQGKWATLCLPFNVNKAMMMSLGLYNRVFAFRYAQQLDDETIQVFFVPAQSIEAGKGYIVNPNAKLAAKTSFVFPNVTINTDSDNGDITALTGYNDGTGRGNLFLVGTLRTGMLQGTTTGNTYLGLKDNVLYYPNTTTGTPMRAYRAVFRYFDGSVQYALQRLRIVAEGETVTELQVVGTDSSDWSDKSDPSYTPARKYIDNGILFIERNGITYTAQGQRLD